MQEFDVSKDYFQVLGLSPDVSQEVLEKTYRTLARKYHPDVNPDPQARERMAEINEAYQVLKDPERRQRYLRVRKVFQRLPNPQRMSSPLSWFVAFWSQGNLPQSHHRPDGRVEHLVTHVVHLYDYWGYRLEATTSLGTGWRSLIFQRTQIWNSMKAARRFALPWRKRVNVWVGVWPVLTEARIQKWETHPHVLFLDGVLSPRACSRLEQMHIRVFDRKRFVALYEGTFGERPPLFDWEG